MEDSLGERLLFCENVAGSGLEPTRQGAALNDRRRKSDGWLSVPTPLSSWVQPGPPKVTGDTEESNKHKRTSPHLAAEL